MTSGGTPSSFYTINLIILALITIGVGYYEHLQTIKRDSIAVLNDQTIKDEEEIRTSSEERELKRFKINYLMVYALVMSSDWLQGPFLFSLYHDEYGISLHTIAILFVIGFLSAGVTAPYVGSWADRYGRKRLCIVFTIAYGLSCLTKMFKPLIFLGSGRLLGGLATSILFSVFESWLVSSARSKGMTAGELGAFLGRCTLVNGMVAATSGVVSDGVVAMSGTFKSPFVTSGILLLVAGVLISRTWAENYGGQHSDVPDSSMQTQPIKRSLDVLKANPSLIVVVFVMTCYETSMYLFVFLWVPTMQDSTTSVDGPLPLGTIFSAFMIAMVLGSMLYNGILARVSHHFDKVVPQISRPSGSDPLLYGGVPSNEPEGSNSHDTEHDPPLRETDSIHHHTSTSLLIGDLPFSPFASTSILFHGELLSLVLLFAAAALAASVVTPSATIRFYSFLIFEGSVGMYYPILGTLRSAMVPEECRATLSAIFRVPLNLLVTLALVTGMESRRDLTFALACGMLILGSIATTNILVKRATGGVSL